MNLLAVQNPVSVNPDTITGHLESGVPVVLERRKEGWTVRLSVTVDGVCVHDDEPTPLERVHFDRLYTEAFERADVEQRQKREDAIASAWAQGLFPGRYPAS